MIETSSQEQPVCALPYCGDPAIGQSLYCLSHREMIRQTGLDPQEDLAELLWRKKRRRRLCAIPSCTHKASTGSLCWRHKSYRMPEASTEAESVLLFEREVERRRAEAAANYEKLHAIKKCPQCGKILPIRLFKIGPGIDRVLERCRSCRLGKNK